MTNYTYDENEQNPFTRGPMPGSPEDSRTAAQGTGVRNAGTFTLTHANMSLRDYFAAQALPALIALTPTVSNRTDSLVTEIVAAAYGFADVMLERRKTP